MAKVSAPEFKLPEFKARSVDLDALFALQKANLAVAHEAQTVLVEAAQKIVKAQAHYVQDLLAQLKANLATKEPKKAQTVLADVQAAAEKAVAVGKSNVDLTLVAQRRVADLVSQRVQANINEFKALAA
jgi:hypothetical protein